MTTKPQGFLYAFRLAILIIAPMMPIVAGSAAGGAEVNGIAAKVNGRVITKNEVSFLLAPKLENLKKQFPDGGEEFDALLAEARKILTQELIDRHILLVQFADLRIEIAPESIEKEVRRELRENYQGKVELLRDALKTNRITMDSFRMLLRDRLLETEIKKLQQKDE